MKILTVGTDFFRAADGQVEGRADGQTDMTKLIVALLNFANASINRYCVLGMQNN